MSAAAYPLIVHSHLRWDWVWQRPQQFISRFSRDRPVLFVEGPEPGPIEKTSLRVREVSDYPNLIILQMTIPASRWKDGAWVDKERRRMVQNFLSGPLGALFAKPVQWFYDPMAVTSFAGHLDERALVYDCMDELSAFRGALPELSRRERELLALADVVFAGGPKIWEAKRALNANCFCYGCGVDAAHFGTALLRHSPVAEELRDLPRPIYGYFGVVDERIDYSLVAHLADSTSGSVVMVGPWTKVDPLSLPQKKNLHWLGGRDYSSLPAYAKGFDVCLMPFALNEATEFINPTKALEYMAAGRPIVSTAVTDVVRQFERIVHIAKSEAQFAEMAARVAKKPVRARLQRGLQVVERSSWDSIVRRLKGHIQDVLASKRELAMNAA